MFGNNFSRTYYETRTSGEADKAIKFYQYPVNWVVFSWFTGFGLIVFFIFKTLISIDAIFHIFLIMGVVTTAIHFFLTKQRELRMLPAMAFYNFFGLAALLCGLFLLANYSFQGEPFHETYQIVELDKQRQYGGRMNANEVTLNQKFNPDFKYLISFDQWKWNEFKEAKAIKVTYTKGLFGYKIYKNASLLY